MNKGVFQKRFSLVRVLVFIVAFSTLLAACSKKRKGSPRVLVFSKTAGFVHSSIPAGIAAIQKLGADNGFSVDTTSNADYFTEDSLAKYAAVIFLSTTGNVLNHRQEVAFERYIQSGGGFAGVHSATDTEYDWGWFTRLVGGQFASHPHNQDAVLRVQGEDLEFLIENSKPERLPRHDHPHSGGIGLTNVRQRLQLLYPEDHTLEVQDEPHRYGVTLRLKLI